MLTITPTEPLGFDGFTLRLPCDDDADALIGFGDDPDTAETLWVPIPTPCSRGQAEARIRAFLQGWRGRSILGATLVIAPAVGGERVGVLFLRARDGAAVEIAYGIAPERRGLGLATSALQRACAWCFEHLGACRIELRIAPANRASCRVASKVGFEYRGIDRTHVARTGEEYDDLLYVLDAPA